MVELKNQRCEVFHDKLKLIYIELPKFQKKEAEAFDKILDIPCFAENKLCN